MTWSRAQAAERIRKFQDSAPDIKVERYAENYLPRIALERQVARALGSTAPDNPPLFSLADGAAVQVDTVQVYVRLLNYDDFRLDGGRETADSHARGLALLHTLYSAADRVVEGAGGQRVDYHGARLHAVVIEPHGEASVRERIAAALDLAEQMVELARLAGRQFLGDLGGNLRFRVGIDAGPCVAINSGRSDEREPMFVGPAANHAAKLAAGDVEGIYLSDRVRAIYGLRRMATMVEEKAFVATSFELGTVRGSSPVAYGAAKTAGQFDGWLVEARDQSWTPLSPRDFVFHQHTPPLRSIDYAQLSPSRSIRMPLAVIFADLDGYTAYIDRCMAEGCLEEAVRLLHVLRSEMNAVVQTDFGGRKVRFIGDCILAILAEGSACDIDLQGTITRAALCAGALRSSFDLCGEIIPETRKLGLAIGIETGETPVSRIGIRGVDRAVRVVSSLAVRGSESSQCCCGGTQTRLGPTAYANATAAVRSLFWRNRTADGLTYNDVVVATDGSRVAATVAATPAARVAPAVVTGAAAAAIAAPARGYLAD